MSGNKLVETYLNCLGNSGYINAMIDDKNKESLDSLPAKPENMTELLCPRSRSPPWSHPHSLTVVNVSSKSVPNAPSIDCESCGSSLIGRKNCPIKIAICTICLSVKSSPGPPVFCLDCVSTHMAFGHSLDAVIFATPSDDEVASSSSLTENQKAKRAKLE